mgnify:FL=1
MGVDIKVETNGSGGVKNHLTEADIKRLSALSSPSIKTYRSSVAGKKVIFTKVANGIKIPEELIQTILDGKAPVYQARNRLLKR